MAVASRDGDMSDEFLDWALRKPETQQAILARGVRLVCARMREVFPPCKFSAKFIEDTLEVLIRHEECYGRPELAWRFVLELDRLLDHRDGSYLDRECVFTNAAVETSGFTQRRWRLTLSGRGNLRSLVMGFVSSDDAVLIASRLLSAGIIKQDAEKPIKLDGWVYFISDGDFIKIGQSRTCPYGRIRSLQTASSTELKFLAMMRGADREQELHKRFAHLRARGEWFRQTEELIDFIKSIPGNTISGASDAAG
jgi:hypothetical protein